MVTISAEYLGSLRTKAIHWPSGTELITDAPTDNQGKGESFSPTDLLTTALVTCIATMIGIQAKALDLDLAGMKLTINKVMSTKSPRRIVHLPIEVWIPCGLKEKQQQFIERAASRCPVFESMHPDIEKSITFHWNSEA